jgi:signal transduction histidine kinase
VEHTGQRHATDRNEAHRSSVPKNRRPLRTHTVRARVVSLLVVPIVSLSVLWALAAVTTAQDYSRLSRVHRLEAHRGPVADALAALRTERQAAALQTAAPSVERAAFLRRTALRTDEALGRLRTGGEPPSAVREEFARFSRQGGDLPSLRTVALREGADWDATFAGYTALIATGLDLMESVTTAPYAGPATVPPVPVAIPRAAEALARENALLTSARLGRPITAQRLRTLIASVEIRRNSTVAAAVSLREPQRTAWRELATLSAYGELEAAEDRATGARPGASASRAVPPARWDRAHAAVAGRMLAVEAEAVRASAAERRAPALQALRTPAGAAFLTGLGAIPVSALLFARTGGRLIRRVRDLRDSAAAMARDIPAPASEPPGAGEETGRTGTGAPTGKTSGDEFAQVSAALESLHRAAARGAAGNRRHDAVVRPLVGLALRNKALVETQLALLDELQLGADDPGELDRLFRLDHLATRMRRQTESLLALTGEPPADPVRRPAPLNSLVRAAAAETEEYTRTEVSRFPGVAVTGPAVGGLTHLLAELIENATRFSPPHTQVRITGGPVGTGYAVEIEDRGPGMAPRLLADIDRALAEPGAPGLPGPGLGLRIAGRLALQHGVGLRLRTALHGGTVAVVLLPAALLNRELPEGRRLTAVTAGSQAAGTVPADTSQAVVPALAPRLAGIAAASAPRTVSPPRPAAPSPAPPLRPGRTAPDPRPALPRGDTPGSATVVAVGRERT